MKFVDFLKEAVALKTENNDHDILDTNLKDVSASIFTYHAKKLNDILKDFYKQVEKYIKQRYDDSEIDVSKTFFDKDKNEFTVIYPIEYVDEKSEQKEKLYVAYSGKYDSIKNLWTDVKLVKEGDNKIIAEYLKFIEITK